MFMMAFFRSSTMTKLSRSRRWSSDTRPMSLLLFLTSLMACQASMCAIQRKTAHLVERAVGNLVCNLLEFVAELGHAHVQHAGQVALVAENAVLLKHLCCVCGGVANNCNIVDAVGRRHVLVLSPHEHEYTRLRTTSTIRHIMPPA